jgi:hypothetical protein
MRSVIPIKDIYSLLLTEICQPQAGPTRALPANQSECIAIPNSGIPVNFVATPK